MSREERVEFFNKLMNQPIGTDPKLVPLELRKLGIKIIFEELAELANASGVPLAFNKCCEKQLKETKAEEDSVSGDGVDPVLQLDGACDVQYTLSWVINVFGLKEHFEDAYIETCKSNNSKACTSMEEAQRTKEYWEKKDGDERVIEPNVVDGVMYYIVKRLDGKVTKSVDYIPANFAQFFNKKKCEKSCMYSKSMNQPFPRLCVKCNNPEITD